MDSSIRTNDFAVCSITTHPCKERKDGPPAEAVDQAEVGDLVSKGLRSTLDKLLLTAQSLQVQLRLLDQERRNTPHQT